MHSPRSSRFTGTATCRRWRQRRWASMWSRPSSGRVSSTLAHRDELWTRCHADLMAQAHARLEQEVARLGGRYAHVLNESIDPHHDAATGDAWLQGRFTYMLYR